MASTLIYGTRVFDGQDVRSNTDVLVVDGVIAKVGPSIDAPLDAERIDGTNKTLIPGLIDAHVHVQAPALQMAINFGVTTQLDMFAEPENMIEYMRQAQLRNDISDIKSAMVGASVAGGHPSGMVGRFFDKQFPVLTSAAEAPAFVAQQIAHGADYIKIMIEDGTTFGMPSPDLPEETILAVVNAAHAHGKLAVAHAATFEATEIALRSGIDGLMHSFGNKPIDDELLNKFVASGAFVVPTLVTLGSILGHTTSAHVVEDERARPYISAEWYASVQEVWPPGAPGDFDYVIETTRRLHAAGIDVLAGTDSVLEGAACGAHGISLHSELQLLVRAGLTPVQALRAATSLTAKRFGFGDRGSIAAGLQADLVLIDGDPTTRIEDTLSINGIWRRGERLNRLAVVQTV